MTKVEIAIIAVIVAIVGAIAIPLVDSVGISTETYQGRVSDKRYTQEHYSQVYIDGKMQSQYHPASYTIVVCTDAYDCVPCSTGQSFYDNTQVGDSVYAELGEGRFSETIWCKGVSNDNPSW